MKKISGTCGCKAVSFTAEGDITGAVSCHCKLCQRLHGNYNPMVIIEKSDFILRTSDTLEWFDSSAEARRGFCRLCGSALFKEQKTGPKILVSIGSLDNTDDWHNIKNVFTEEAGHYYLLPPEGE
jgi:hypothetical protein